MSGRAVGPLSWFLIRSSSFITTAIITAIIISDDPSSLQ
jgi:hypothetical protein